MKSFCMFVDFSPLRLVRQFLFDYFSDFSFFVFATGHRMWRTLKAHMDRRHGIEKRKFLMISRKDSPKKTEQPASEIIY